MSVILNSIKHISYLTFEHSDRNKFFPIPVWFSKFWSGLKAENSGKVSLSQIDK